MKVSSRRRSWPLLAILVLLSIFIAEGFQSDVLLQDNAEFELVGEQRADADPKLPTTNPIRPPTRRPPDLDPPVESSDSDSIQFPLEHNLGGPAFSTAGTFTAHLKSWSHGGQTLSKLRVARNVLTEEERGAFERLLEEDGYYTIRVPSNLLNHSGQDYVVSSIRARCIPHESLDEHFVFHADGVNILSVNYCSARVCEFPRLLRCPAKWSFTSYTLLKNNEQVPRTPTFAEQLLAGEHGLSKVVKPSLLKFFLAKYWMYLIPLGFTLKNVITQILNMPEEPASGRSASQEQQQAAQHAPTATSTSRRR